MSLIRAWSGVIKWVSLAVIAISLFVLMQSLPLGDAMAALKSWVESLGFWGPVVFGAIYVVGTLILVPGSILTLAAGATFGLLVGFITTSLASTTGAAIAFLIARYLARGYVEQAARQRPKFAAVDKAVDEGGWKIVVMLRLSPAIPFNLQNYLYGLTSLHFVPYVIASWVAMIPGTFLYVYLGHVAGLATGGNRQRSVWEWVMLGVGLLATIAVTVYVTRLAKQKLIEETELSPDDLSAEQEQPEEIDEKSDESEGSPVGTLVLAAIALLMALAASFAYMQPTRVFKLVASVVPLGPPPVEMQEVYARRPDGPSVDHSAFDELLTAHVDDAGWVDYEALMQDEAQLDAYLAGLKSIPYEELGRHERLATLINAYNAFTLKLILEHWPVNSIKDISEPHRWQDVRWQVGPRTWSLEQIEHEVIRAKFKEPRIHFALVCAAVGCPPLRNEAYTAGRLEAQLDDQTIYVHQQDTWLEYVELQDELKLTKIYDWYGGDFEQVAPSVIEYAARYHPELNDAVRQNAPVNIKWLKYDWALNDISNRRPR